MKGHRSLLLPLIALGLVAPAAFSQTADPAATLTCKRGNLNQESPATIAAMTRFLNELKSDIKTYDAAQVAQMISYPLLVSTESGKKRIRSEKQFVAEYATIFPRSLETFVLRQEPQCISRVGAQGFTVGYGEIWFDIFPDGKVKIFTINPVAVGKLR